MSEKIKYTAKELRKPDRLRQILADGVDSASKHFNKILIAVGLIFLGIIILFVSSSIGKKKEINANIEFQNALDTYNSGQILESLDKFSEVNEKFGKGKISTLALYYMGLINYDLEEYDLTIKYLEEFLDRKIDDKIIRESAILNIGLSYFNLGKWQESIEYLSKIQDDSSPYYKQAMLHLGMSYEKNGDFEKSEEIYRQILSNNSIG